MTESQWRQEFERLGALWIYQDPPSEERPHALLTSGNHSNGFFNGSLVVYDAELCKRACVDLWEKAEHTKEYSGLTGVFGSAMGAVGLSALFGAMLGKKSGFTEKVDGDMVNKRFPVNPGDKFFVIEDVLTTGGTTLKTIKALESQGAVVLPEIFVLVNRSGRPYLEGRKVTALIEADLPIWAPDLCPYCEAGSEAIRPKNENWARLTGQAA